MQKIGQENQFQITSYFLENETNARGLQLSFNIFQ